jgi:hypothetical protein
MSVYSLDDGGKELPSDIRDQLLSLRRLDAKCAELDRKLQDVRRQRDAVYRGLELFCESRAPIRRVPYEVLAIIFSNYPEAQKSRNSSLIRVCKLPASGTTSPSTLSESRSSLSFGLMLAPLSSGVVSYPYISSLMAATSSQIIRCWNLVQRSSMTISPTFTASEKTRS